LGARLFTALCGAKRLDEDRRFPGQGRDGALMTLERTAAGKKAMLPRRVSWRILGGGIGWLLLVFFLANRFVNGSGFVIPFLAACGLALLFYLLRSRNRLFYGMLEFLVGAVLLGNAIYSGAGRGPFSSDFSADFARFDTRLILLQSYGGLFIMIRGLDNISEGSAKCRQLIIALSRKVWP
jgi:hypothetical protein